MKSKPVRKYASPELPTRPEAAARPGLLPRHQPPACHGWPEPAGAVGFLLLADTARLSAAVRSIDLATTHDLARQFVVSPTLE
jgi:hypothetical protein